METLAQCKNVYAGKTAHMGFIILNPWAQAWFSLKIYECTHHHNVMKLTLWPEMKH